MAGSPYVDLMGIGGDGIPRDGFITNVAGQGAVTLNAVAKRSRLSGEPPSVRKFDWHPSRYPVDQHQEFTSI